MDGCWILLRFSSKTVSFSFSSSFSFQYLLSFSLSFFLLFLFAFRELFQCMDVVHKVYKIMNESYLKYQNICRNKPYKKNTKHYF